MAKSIPPGGERKVPMSVSLEYSLHRKFEWACRNINSRVSVEVRKFVIDFIKKQEKNNTKKINGDNNK